MSNAWTFGIGVYMPFETSYMNEYSLQSPLYSDETRVEIFSIVQIIVSLNTQLLRIWHLDTTITSKQKKYLNSGWWSQEQLNYSKDKKLPTFCIANSCHSQTRKVWVYCTTKFSWILCEKYQDNKIQENCYLCVSFHGNVRFVHGYLPYKGWPLVSHLRKKLNW